MHPSEVAHSLESLPPMERKFLWSLIDTQDEGEIIAELHDEIQQELISEISSEELIDIMVEGGALGLSFSLEHAATRMQKIMRKKP